MLVALRFQLDFFLSTKDIGGSAMLLQSFYTLSNPWGPTRLARGLWR